MRRVITVMMIILFAGLSLGGCATWHGLKKDTKRTWQVITS